MTNRKDLANGVRFLSVDAIQKANSGHPGAPMGMADIAEVLFNDFLRHNPGNPRWCNRDRFVLSNGHASMLLYSLLHLSGYDVTMEDIKNFRQLGSKTPGHPENVCTPGVETTTGPLAQGLANGVGMALGEKLLAARYNTDNHKVVNHYTYVFAGDGCLMEGLSHEVCSLAGTWKLGKLIVLYDDNGISIDGPVEGWFTDDTAKRFDSYGWHVERNVDGHDPVAIKAALEKARSETELPSIICCKTTIGFGAPTLAGSEKTHGSPLGEKEIAGLRESLGWKHEPFEVPENIYAAWDAKEKGARWEEEWKELFRDYAGVHPEKAEELERRLAGRMDEELERSILDFAGKFLEQGVDAPSLATRQISQKLLNVLGPHLPELFGGSADLTPSNNTTWESSEPVTGNLEKANYAHYGVREFGMAAIGNGLALYGGFIPYGGTFLVFSDYCRNAIRMAALMEVGSIFVFTHDSIALGEDGPTHQPVEHAAGLRLIPEIRVWRPSDAVECGAAWLSAVKHRDGPTCLLLTRQKTGVFSRTPKGSAGATLDEIKRGGYIVRECSGGPDAIDAVIIATGSEVAVAIDAADILEKEGRGIRVVSMPCVEIFDGQEVSYKESVLPSSIRTRVAVEAGATPCWYKYTGLDGRVLGIDKFGASAPSDVLMKEYGFTSENIAASVRELL